MTETIATLKARQLLRAVEDRTIHVQKAVVSRLRTHAGLVSLIAGRVYDRPAQGVTFPYLTIGDDNSIPFDAEGLHGIELDMQIHGWSRTPGRVECRQIMAQVNDALHHYELPLVAGNTVLCRATSSRTMGDPDGITTHSVQHFTVIAHG